MKKAGNEDDDTKHPFTEGWGTGIDTRDIWAQVKRN
jgi:hypothetical protein